MMVSTSDLHNIQLSYSRGEFRLYPALSVPPFISSADFDLELDLDLDLDIRNGLGKHIVLLILCIIYLYQRVNDGEFFFGF